MKSALKVAAAAAVLALVLVVAYKISSPGKNAAATAGERIEPVKTGVVRTGPISQEVEITGEVQALAMVALAPKVNGRLMELVVDEGDIVKTGETVARLDTDTFKALVDQARGAVEVARAGVKSAEVTHANAGREYERMESLFKQGTTPEAARDDAEARYAVTGSAVDVAKANETQALAALEMADIQMREATLYAPFDAVVSKKLLDIGALVAPGQPVVALVSIDNVKVIAGVSEEYLGDLETGVTRAVVTVDAVKGRTFDGTLFRVSPTIDARTRTAEADVRIENAEHVLKPGMFARVMLVTKHKDEALLLPSDALLGREGNCYVYVVKDQAARRTAVETGLRSREAVEVLGGLSEGDVIVTSGEGNLYDTAPVVTESKTAEAAR